MQKKLAARMITMTFALVLLLSFNASAANEVKKAKVGNPVKAQTNCAKTTDEDLLKAIKERLEADPVIKEQMNHLNVSVKKRVVKLEGWLDGQEMVSKAVAIVKKTKCVKSVVNKLKTRGGGSCGPGQKPCGDICIDKDSTCTIGGSQGTKN